MALDYLTSIKADAKVKPIHYSKRTPVDLIIGNKYYVSFGRNVATTCTLIEVEGDRDVKRITIEIPTKPQSKNGVIDKNRNISHNWVSTHSIYSDEIGLSPEEAVMNEVTF